MPVSGDQPGAWEQGAVRAPATVDQQLLWAPLNTLARRSRWLAVVSMALLTTAWSALLNGNLVVAWGLPDVKFYVLMAQDRFDQVPAPFSARPLVPLLARWIAAPGHWSTETGFAVLAFASVLWASGVVFWLATRSAAPRWTLLLLAAVPFWPQLIGDAGLPDALYTALLAALLVALERRWVVVAGLTLFPLFLTRESSALTLLCLLVAGWRFLRWRGTALALGGTAGAALLVRHLSRNSLPNPEHMSAGLYLLGKVISNTVRSVGVLPWSNVYPELCGTPAWQHALQLGPVRSVGFCSYTAQTPRQALLALATTFGLLPLLWLVCWKGWRRAIAGDEPVLRFCLLYGGISFVIAPTLGTWYARLFGYGWPLLLVAVPRLLGWKIVEGQRATAAGSPYWMALLLLQLLLATGTQVLLRPWAAVGIAGCWGLAIALVLVQKRAGRERTERPEPATSTW